MTTNGTLLPPLAKDLHEAGVKRVNISLDTLVPENSNILPARDSLKML